MSHTLPRLVLALTSNHDAWIVGSAADPANTSPRDYDVQVPYSEWGKACHLIPADAKPNSFGGWKCVQDGIEIDVWPGELGHVMRHPKTRWAWHPQSGVRLSKPGFPVGDIVENPPFPVRDD